MTIKKVNQLDITLKDGSTMRTFNDYIGKFINDSKDYYEKNILDFFKDYIPHSSVIFDLGSNIGNHTLYFSKQTNAKTIYSFEPSKETFELLGENIKRNQLENVISFNVGVGQENSKATLFSDSDNMGASYLQPADNGEIEVVALDTLDLLPPDFIKIDVEGYEQQVIKGASEVIRKSTPVIWIEIFEENYKEVDGLLTEYGYIQIDRWFDNYIYVHPKNDRELLDYTVKFKERPLKRFTEYAKETNRKYRNVTSKVTELTNRLKKTTEDIAAKEKNSDYERELLIKELENKFLNSVIQLKAEITKLESDKNATLRILGGHGDINSNILKLQQKISAIQEEKNQLNELYNNSKETVIVLRKDIEHNKEIHQLHLESMKEHSEKLTAMLKQLQDEVDTERSNGDKFKSELEQLKRKESGLTTSENKRLNDELTKTKAALQQALKENEGLKNTLQTSLTEEEKALKHILVQQNELKDTKTVLFKVENEFSKLEKKYLSLKKSRLGRITLKYWKLRKKIRI
ncbi:FkbM family methyltransferase (plasmid) [Rossellomorea sp. AcN35-11]|nr:FkbM family methyltransferase [Rossellomorea aquimaris]WJV32357.1 FkbM family methyltransferase [Rossellomorea sp. AcN35-11]